MQYKGQLELDIVLSVDFVKLRQKTKGQGVKFRLVNVTEWS